jgi:hypothetical protein
LRVLDGDGHELRDLCHQLQILRRVGVRRQGSEAQGAERAPRRGQRHGTVARDAEFDERFARIQASCFDTGQIHGPAGLDREAGIRVVELRAAPDQPADVRIGRLDEPADQHVAVALAQRHREERELDQRIEMTAQAQEEIVEVRVGGESAGHVHERPIPHIHDVIEGHSTDEIHHTPRVIPPPAESLCRGAGPEYCVR